MEIEWTLEDWAKIANETFLPLVNNNDRFLICWGGRNSSKSTFLATKLIYQMLTLPENTMRCICIRNVYKDHKESTYQTLLDIISNLGLNDFFTAKKQPLEIHCSNGNKIIFRGLDKPSSIKSIREMSQIWWEEDVPTYDAWFTITSSIRSTSAEYLQEVFSINPVLSEVDYKDNWFWQKFFSNHPTENSFRDNLVTTLEDGSQIKTPFTVHHSTYKANRFVKLKDVIELEESKFTDPYKYNTQCLGNWGNKQTGGNFYKLFNRATNTTSEVKYNPAKPLFISFDFNLHPYLACVIFQVDGKHAYAIDEIAGKHPANTPEAVCKEFIRRYPAHSEALFVFGDPSGKREDFNYFTTILNVLDHYHPQLRIFVNNPGVAMRGNFINTVFLQGFNNVQLTISENCKFLLEDLMALKEAPDGEKLKEKTTKDGKKIELLGHMSDALDYFFIYQFQVDYELYKNGNRQMIRKFGQKTPNKKFHY